MCNPDEHFHSAARLAKRITPWRLVLIITCLPLRGEAQVPASSETLRLEATQGADVFHEFAVEKGRIVITDAAGSRPLPRGVKWRLQGDLLANRDRLDYSPSYRLVQRVAVPGVPLVDRRYLASVVIRYTPPWKMFSTNWKTERLENAIAVVVWLVDGKPVQVVPVATRPDLSENDIAAIVPVELTDAEARGVPVMLLLSSGKWEKPIPLFEDPKLQDALSAMILSPSAEFRAALDRLKSAGAKNRSRGTLLQYAAESGNAEAIRELLAKKAYHNGDDGYWGSPLHAAAANGRLEAVKVLLASRSSRNPVYPGIWPLDRALTARHSEVAACLAGPKWNKDHQRVLELSLQQGCVEVAETLAGFPQATLPRKTLLRLEKRVDELGDPRLLAVMARLDNTMPGSESRRPPVPSPARVDLEPIRAANQLDVPVEIRVRHSADAELSRQLGFAGNRLEEVKSSYAIVTVTVELDGTASAAVVEKASSEGFGENAAAAAAKYRFSPGKVGGKPVRSRFVIAVTPD
jgi:hypothetical protein